MDSESLHLVLAPAGIPPLAGGAVVSAGVVVAGLGGRGAAVDDDGEVEGEAVAVVLSLLA